MFVAENVQGLLNMGNGTVIRQMVKEFEEKNYKVSYKLLNAKDYGVPQERKRVFIVGVRADLDLQFTFPEPTFGTRSRPQKTLKDAIWKHKDSPGEYYSGTRNDRFMTRQHKKPWHKPSYCVVTTAWSIPLHPEGKLMKPTHWDKYGRGDMFIFVGDSNRTLSIKECLAIQTFPENYELKGDLISQYRQVGNGVPPLLAEELANAVRKCLNSVKRYTISKNSQMLL